MNRRNRDDFRFNDRERRDNQYNKAPGSERYCIVFVYLYIVYSIPIDDRITNAERITIVVIRTLMAAEEKVKHITFKANEMVLLISHDVCTTAAISMGTRCSQILGIIIIVSNATMVIEIHLIISGVTISKIRPRFSK